MQISVEVNFQLHATSLTTCNMLTTKYSLFPWTFHIFNLFPQVIPFFLLNPLCEVLRPMTGSVVLYLIIIAHSKFLSLAVHFFSSFTCGNTVAHLYIFITLKKLNAINIVFPHVSILPSQTNHQVD